MTEARLGREPARSCRATALGGGIAVGSVVDDGLALSLEVGQAVCHRPHLLAGVARPVT